MDFCEGDGDLSASGSSRGNAKVSAVLPEKHDSDTNELFHGAETISTLHAYTQSSSSSSPLTVDVSDTTRADNRTARTRKSTQ